MSKLFAAAGRRAARAVYQTAVLGGAAAAGLLAAIAVNPLLPF